MYKLHFTIKSITVKIKHIHKTVLVNNYFKQFGKIKQY